MLPDDLITRPDETVDEKLRIAQRLATGQAVTEALQDATKRWLDSGAWRAKPQWQQPTHLPSTNYSPMPQPSPTPDIVASTIAERGKVYGEPHLSHTNIGLAWTGLIQQHYGIRLDHPLPHWLVEQMLASFKILRAARVFHDDNYVDAAAYLRFARHGQEHPSAPYQSPTP